jgi:hypothetical protein
MAFAASARDFAEGFRSQLHADTILEKINAQVSHLGFGRKTSPSEKLGSIDMNWIKPAIDSEIKRFESLLDPECREHWRQRHPITLSNILANQTMTSTAAMTTITLSGLSIADD